MSTLCPCHEICSGYIPRPSNTNSSCGCLIIKLFKGKCPLCGDERTLYKLKVCNHGVCAKCFVDVEEKNNGDSDIEKFDDEVICPLC